MDIYRGWCVRMFVRIDMKHSNFSNLFAICCVVCQIVMFMQNLFLLYKEILSNFVYVLVHRNTLMCDILAGHLLDMHLKTILAEH